MKRWPRKADPDPRLALHVVNHLDGYLSANQLGITIASLALGFLGEPFVKALVSPVLASTGMPQTWIYWISLILAFASFTFLHVVIGELVPKSIAIRKSVPVTMPLVGPLHVFYKSFHWAIVFFNGTANWLLEKRLPHRPGQRGRAHPLGRGTRAARHPERKIPGSHRDRAGDPHQRPRPQRTLGARRDDAAQQGGRSSMPTSLSKRLWKSRCAASTPAFPLVKGHLDHAIGLIHIKDLFKLIDDPDPDLMRIKRELKIVPDTMPLDTLLKFFLREHAHLAMAVDEFGTPVGIVFLDNVMEELVGDIQDEFDNERSSFTRINDDEFVIEGAMTLNDLAGHVPELFLESGEVTTVGGYLTQQLERFPEVGETVEVLGYEARVTSTDGRRVGQVHFRKLPDPAEEEEKKGRSTADVD